VFIFRLVPLSLACGSGLSVVRYWINHNAETLVNRLNQHWTVRTNWFDHQQQKNAAVLKVGWRANFFRLIKISVPQNLPESNKSSYWAGDVVKNTVKSWNSQMNFHSVKIFPRDVNCRKRHHSGSTLLHMRACAIDSQTPTSTTLSHFWLLGSKYEHEMSPKAKTKTYEFTAFSLFLTLSLPRNQSEWY